MRIALDTNVLVYAESLERSPADVAKISISRHLMQRLILTDQRPIFAVQVLAELHHVLRRKGGLEPSECAERVLRVGRSGDITALGRDGLETALELASEHRLQIFDALVLASAAEARCDLLLSEDFQDGFAWRGVVVTNPFGAARDPRLARVLAGG